MLEKKLNKYEEVKTFKVNIFAILCFDFVSVSKAIIGKMSLINKKIEKFFFFLRFTFFTLRFSLKLIQKVKRVSVTMAAKKEPGDC